MYGICKWKDSEGHALVFMLSESDLPLAMELTAFNSGVQ